jgi:hypothetical protein
MWKENKSCERAKGGCGVILKGIQKLLLMYFRAATVVCLILSVLTLGILTKKRLGINSF